MTQQGVREWTIMHPEGFIEVKETATNFGPTKDLQEALLRLKNSQSDCMCHPYEDARVHVLVTRFIPTPTHWETYYAEQ